MTPPTKTPAQEGDGAVSPELGSGNAGTEGSQPIKIDLPLISVEEAMQKLLNPAPIPDEPTTFEDLVQKIRDLLEPTFPLTNKITVNPRDPLPCLTEKQKRFIKFLFDGRADRIINKRIDDMKAVTEQVCQKTNGTMQLPESEKIQVFLFHNASTENLQYVSDMRLIICLQGGASSYF